MAVILETSLGDITVDLYTDERPRCCLNFLKLCKMKYYNFSLFHSVQSNLVAQCGDPTGTGKGGCSVYGKLYGEQANFFETEAKPRIKHRKHGTLSMVNDGNNMHGSQFFLTLAADIDYLDDKHTVFGEVAEGFPVLDKFNEVFSDQDGRPYKDIRLFHTVVLDDPYDDPAGLSALVPDRSPEPTAEQRRSGRIGVDEDINDYDGKTEAEVEELIAEKEAAARTQILEMVGDIPDVDVKPPDNVLFVCKLNPVTTGEDLEIIFSRFGTITSCEVIKDEKTGESLQYAFIEFDTSEECERAYFKMDNVLIDDRRIHVDFSQSVAKLQWKGKGKGVEVKDTSGSTKPQFVVKDQARKTAGYDLVFEEPPSGETRKKHKKHKSRDSPREDSHRDKHACDSHKKEHKSKSRKRSPSPDRKEERSRDRYKEQSRDKYRDRSRDTDRYRDRSRDRYRDDSRDKRRRDR